MSTERPPPLGPPDSTSGTKSSLSADSTYDDQGLVFSLILCGVLLLFYVPLVLYLMGTSKLWLKRFYRPNHTVEPPPREPCLPETLRATAGGAVEMGERSSHRNAPREDDDDGDALPFPIHETENSSMVRTRTRQAEPLPGLRRRRKRLGISLPYRSTIFCLPTWRDWINVEERVPHLEGALSEHHLTGVAPARFTGSRSYIPLSPTTGRRRVSDVTIETTSPTFSSPSPPPQRQQYATTSGGDGSALTPSTPLSPFGETRGAAAHGGPQPRRRYGSVDQSDHGAAAAPSGSVDNLPKTPLDPQVALYTFTLKFFASLMILGECFTFWISIIANQDDYNEYVMVQLDPKKCHKQDANETGCLLKRPYCQYVDEESGCAPVALPGLYDLTTKNITPGSWRWWPVVLLNCGFCLVLVCLTVFYISRVSQYVHDVMLHQMKHALGYRVACVRGIDPDEMKSVSVFSANFLQERSYFLPRPGAGRGDGSHRHPSGHRNNNNNSSNGGGGGGGGAGRVGIPSPLSIDLQRDRSLEDEFDYYEQVDCNGFDCLFGIVGCHYYTTHRSDAVFTRPGRVKQILFTRKPPPGMYAAIGDAESAMAKLQDAVADEKAVKRKLRRRQQRAMAEAQRRHPPLNEDDGGGRGGATATVAAPPPPPPLQTSPGHGVRRSMRSNLNSRLFSFASPVSSSGGSSEESAAPVELSTTPPGEGPVAPTPAAAAAAAAAGHRASRSMYTDSSVLGPEDNVDDLVLYTRSCTWATCCQDVPAIPYYEAQLRAAGDKLNHMITQVPQQPADSATFVIFTDARSAFEFINLFKARYGGWLTSAVANIAGPPGQVISNNVLTDKLVLFVRYVLVFAVYVVLVFSYSIPIGMLGSLENLSYMPGIGHSFSEYYVTTVPAWLRNIINAYLPVLALSLFYVILPDILRAMVLLMGAFNKAECDAGQLYMQYIFMVLTAVIFQAALQGGFAQLAFLVSAGEGRFITEFFVSCVTPSKANYFYAKVLVAIGFSAWNDLVDPVGIIKALLLRGHVHVQRNYDALFMPCEMEFPKRYPFDLMILSIGLLFHMTMPLLGLFVAVYFIMRYITQRAKLYDRYRPTISPAQDCTDFTVCAQVLRCVMWLYVLAETGGVLLLSLRKHTGGVVVCSLTLATGMLLLVYVHVQTRKWMSTLGRAREFSREIAEERQQRRAEQQQQQQQHGTVKERAGGAAGSPTSPPGSFTSVPTLASATEGSLGDRDTEENHPNANDEGAGMDTYENLRFLLFDDSHSNPFIGYLLPRIPDVSCRYQPKHQRLAPLDVDAEVRKMKNSVFVVERYWDTGMTYFEADVEERRHAPAGAAPPNDGGNDDDDDDIGKNSGGEEKGRHASPESRRLAKARDVLVEAAGDASAPGSGENASPAAAPESGHRELDVVDKESVPSPWRRRQWESETLRDSIVVPPRPVDKPAADADATP